VITNKMNITKSVDKIEASAVDNTTNDVNLVATPDTAANAPISNTITAKMPTMTTLYATTPTGRKRQKREASILLAYAIENGGRVVLSPTVKAELAARGLAEHRMSPAVYDVRKYFGKTVIAERTGRRVSAYTITL